jgi:hypothetical protein
VWQDVQKGWYAPLDIYLEQPNPFVAPGAPGSGQWWDLFKYQAISRGKAAPDGKMYCITLDMIETGVFYNKDVFRSLGLHEPKDWDEFLNIQQKLKDAGYIPLLTDYQQITDWGVDLMFDQLYYNLHALIDLQSDPKRAAYLSNYLDWDEICFLHQKGFFTRHDPRFPQVFRILKDWRRFWPQDPASTDHIKQFMTHRGAMLYAASDNVNRLSRDPDVDFDWGVFYPPKLTKRDSEFASDVDQCVIGGSAMQFCVSNSALKDTPRNLPIEQRMQQSDRMKRVIAFLQLMTLPEHTDGIVNEAFCFLPNVVGVKPHPELKPFDEILKRRYTTTKWSYTFDLRFTEVMNRMLEIYLNDGVTEDEFMEWMEENITTACDTIRERKKLDLTPFQRVWDARLSMRKTLPGLPDDAR